MYVEDHMHQHTIITKTWYQNYKRFAMITLDITLNVFSPLGTIKENYKRITDDLYTMTTGIFERVRGS